MLRLATLIGTFSVIYANPAPVPVPEAVAITTQCLDLCYPFHNRNAPPPPETLTPTPVDTKAVSRTPVPAVAVPKSDTSAKGRYASIAAPTVPTVPIAPPVHEPTPCGIRQRSAMSFFIRGAKENTRGFLVDSCPRVDMFQEVNLIIPADKLVSNADLKNPYLISVATDNVPLNASTRVLLGGNQKCTGKDSAGADFPGMLFVRTHIIRIIMDKGTVDVRPLAEAVEWQPTCKQTRCQLSSSLQCIKVEDPSIRDITYTDSYCAECVKIGQPVHVKIFVTYFGTDADGKVRAMYHLMPLPVVPLLPSRGPPPIRAARTPCTRTHTRTSPRPRVSIPSAHSWMIRCSLRGRRHPRLHPCASCVHTSPSPAHRRPCRAVRTTR